MSGDKWKPAKYVVLLGVKVFSEDLSVVWAGNDLGLDPCLHSDTSNSSDFRQDFFRAGQSDREAN